MLAESSYSLAQSDLNFSWNNGGMLTAYFCPVRGDLVNISQLNLGRLSWKWTFSLVEYPQYEKGKQIILCIPYVVSKHHQDPNNSV